MGINDVAGGAYPAPGSTANPGMVTGRLLPFVRPTSEESDPKFSWSVPTRAIPEVHYRDVIILNSRNEFYAVQNLFEKPLAASGNNEAELANREDLENLLRAAATPPDTDDDGLPDDWELDHFGHRDTLPGTLVPNGLPALVSFAFSAPPAGRSGALEPVPTIESWGGPERFLTLRYRRRLGLAGGLQYFVESSTNLTTWSPAEITEVLPALNPYDGTGTEIVTVHWSSPLALSGPRRTLRIRVGRP